MRVLSTITNTLVCAAIGCGSGSGQVDAGPPDAADAVPAFDGPASGADHLYVIDEVLLPVTLNQAAQYALNIDWDLQNLWDNRLGEVLSTLSSFAGLSLQEPMDVRLARGQVIHLLDLQATALTDATGAGLWSMVGADPVPAPCDGPSDTTCGNHLDGSGSFAVAPPDATTSIVPGGLSGGHFSGGPGRVVFELPAVVSYGSVVVELVGARVEVDTSDAALVNGRLGGAVTADDLENVLLPAMQQAINARIAADCTLTCGPECGCGCTSGSEGATLIDLFDVLPEGGIGLDGDCDVTLYEVVNNDLIGSMMVPDLDLFDDQGDFAPDQDGVDDAWSLGIHFTAVPAAFTLPAGVGGGG